MDEHTSDIMEHERLEVALAHSIEDGATVTFLSLPLLLRQVPKDLRAAVHAAMDRYQPFVNEAKFFTAHIRVNDVPDGSWGVCKSSGLHEGYGLIVACSQQRYDAAIRQIREVFARHQASISLN